MNYQYRLTQLGASSAKYGLCEICGKSTSDVYLQVKQHEMTLPGKSKTHIINDSVTFGCKDCLKSIRVDTVSKARRVSTEGYDRCIGLYIKE